jgi:hypothetical protein
LALKVVIFAQKRRFWAKNASESGQECQKTWQNPRNWQRKLLKKFPNGQDFVIIFGPKVPFWAQNGPKCHLGGVSGMGLSSIGVREVKKPCVSETPVRA